MLITTLILIITTNQIIVKIAIKIAITIIFIVTMSQLVFFSMLLVFSDFTITEKIYGGVSLFFVGERKDIGFNGIETLDSFFDANVNVGYHVNERLSIFAKGSNLLGNNYERWLDFPVQGIQGLLGATYKFDW